MALTRETFTGPWAGLPVAWTPQGKFDEATYRADVARCCQAGIPGVYSGGTTGEFYALEFEEFCDIARATIQQCHAHGKPAMIGCSSTYTAGACRRAAFARRQDADAIQVALPFWLEVGDEQIVPFFQQVSAAGGGLPLSIYETTRAKKTLSIDQHRAIGQCLPNYLMVKANAKTVGATPQGCQALSQWVNVFVGEGLWESLWPCGAVGACSAMVYWNPRVVLNYWNSMKRGDRDSVGTTHQKIAALHQFLHSHFGSKGFTDTAYDRMGGIATGFLKTSLHNRAPYPSATEDDVALLQQWCRENFPELLQL